MYLCCSHELYYILKPQSTDQWIACNFLFKWRAIYISQSDLPDMVVCVLAPPSSSCVTSSLVTDWNMNIHELITLCKLIILIINIKTLLICKINDNSRQSIVDSLNFVAVAIKSINIGKVSLKCKCEAVCMGNCAYLILRQHRHRMNIMLTCMVHRRKNVKRKC